MYRTAIDDLKTWYQGRKRKPLVLRGARQVGKSTLVRLFASGMDLQLIEINLERHLFLDDVFRTLDVVRILAELEGIAGRIDNPDKVLLFLDEVQATPYALQALRYFLEDRPDLAVIAAGSLLEFTLADHSFSMPVGRIVYYRLGPMSFAEFLRVRDAEYFDYYISYNQNGIPAESRHRRLLQYQREYLFCGGMPEAVQTFCESPEKPEDVNEVHRSILDTYTDDFSKYARKRDLALLQRIFRTLPLHVGRKLKYSSLADGCKTETIRSALDLLCKALICTRVYHSDCSGIPLAAGRREKVFKVLYLDVGLLNYLCGMRWDGIRNLDERKLIHEGAMAEQFVGQELLLKYRDELHFWMREGRSNNAELDYVIPDGSSFIPVEVKSGKSGTLKSLHQFVLLKGVSRALRFDLNPSSTQEVKVQAVTSGGEGKDISFRLDSLPLYFAGSPPGLVWTNV